MPHKPPRHRPLGAAATQEQRRVYDRSRDKQDWRRWYKTARWQAIRDLQLQREPLCRICEDAGIITAATVCDHVERHNGDPVRFWSGPFQSLCASCHSSEKQRQENAAS
ncbi:MAG: HNH endonuclease [Rhizobiaceae bacterium]|nr:MAG: HNH endonuclease [Rhizobiaceae bacterium]